MVISYALNENQEGLVIDVLKKHKKTLGLITVSFEGN